MEVVEQGQEGRAQHIDAENVPEGNEGELGVL